MVSRSINISISILEKIYRQCIKNIRGLLTSANLLLVEDTGKFALGLYLYAVEEYGKAVLLKEYLENEKKVEYSIPGWIFGKAKRNVHSNKMEVGFRNLPEECKILSPFLEIRINNLSNSQTFKLLNGDIVSVPAFTTGLFENSLGKNRFIDFKYKTQCFYVDFDSIKNEEINNLIIDKKRMKSNINLLLNAIENF